MQTHAALFRASAARWRFFGVPTLWSRSSASAPPPPWPPPRPRDRAPSAARRPLRDPARGAAPAAAAGFVRPPPAAARVAGQRRLGVDLGHLRRAQLVELAQRRQLAQIPQAEDAQELRRRAVEDRPARPPPSCRSCGRARDRAASSAPGRSRRRGSSSISGPRDRLAVGDDRQRLQHRARQPLRLARDQARHPRDVVGVASAGASRPRPRCTWTPRAPARRRAQRLQRRASPCRRRARPPGA